MRQRYRKGGWGRGQSRRRLKTPVIPFSILVTKVTPGLYINMTKEPLCLSSLPLWAPGLFLPMARMCWANTETLQKESGATQQHPCLPLSPCLIFISQLSHNISWQPYTRHLSTHIKPSTGLLGLRPTLPLSRHLLLSVF